jgi:hypothetical protein
VIVKHIGADGRVRRTFENVSSIYQHQSNHIVTVNRAQLYTQTEGGVPTGLTAMEVPLKYRTDSFGWSVEYPISLIHLAEGESVERADDEPARG